MAFNPEEHITKLPRQAKNKKTGQYETVYDDYLEVKWRLVWFRDRFPGGTIETEEVAIDLDREVEVEATRWVSGKKETYTKKAKGYARYKAIVTDGNGGKATGTKTETAVDFSDFCEKAETGAIGRALAALGIGTQFVGEEMSEKHRIVDSPVKDDEDALVESGDGTMISVKQTNGVQPRESQQARRVVDAVPTQQAPAQSQNGASPALTVESLKVHFTKAYSVPADKLAEKWPMFVVAVLKKPCADGDMKAYQLGQLHGALVARDKENEAKARQATQRPAA